MSDKVVLVPGFMGSTLGREGGGTTKDQVWYQPMRLLLGAYNGLQLAADGVSPGPLANGVRLAPYADFVRPGPWQAVVNSLEAADFEVDYWPYDWRLDIRASAQRLAEYLAEKSVTSPFYVVAHSMGGLVTRLAYPRYLALANGSRWLRTLYVTTPQYGTHEAAQYLARPVQTLSMLGLYSPGLVGYLPGLLNVGLLGILNGKVRGVVASWPSIYQCLPDISTDWIATRPLDPLLYKSGTYQLTNTHVSQTWLDAALATRTELDTTATTTRASERTVLATGFTTPDKLLDPAELGTDAGYILADGDGTVTPLRGGLPGVQDAFTLDRTEHINGMGDSRLLEALPALLRNATVTASNAILIETPPATPPAPVPPVVIDPKGGQGEQRRDDP